MSVSRKVERELLKENYLNKIIEIFTADEEVLRVKSNEIAFPVVGCEGNEDFIVITVKVPTGADKGMTPYDGYAMAEEFELKTKEKEEKAKANAEKKAKKSAAPRVRAPQAGRAPRASTATVPRQAPKKRRRRSAETCASGGAPRR